MVNTSRNNAYKEEPESSLQAGVITEEFVSGSQRQYLLGAKHSEAWESPCFDAHPEE